MVFVFTLHSESLRGSVKKVPNIATRHHGHHSVMPSMQVFVLLSDMSADVRAAAITALARMRDRGFTWLFCFAFLAGQHFTTVIAQRLKAEGEEAKVRIAAPSSAFPCSLMHNSVCTVHHIRLKHVSASIL